MGVEDDGAGIVVRGLGGAVELLVEGRAGGEDRERENQSDAADRDEAAEEVGNGLAAWHVVSESSEATIAKSSSGA